ncbi:MAG: hypothetical protein IPO14_04515 [Saprospiraceae bacterium]|nr:hypothetical protein [Saprospiraceae bacterium]
MRWTQLSGPATTLTNATTTTPIPIVWYDSQTSGDQRMVTVNTCALNSCSIALQVPPHRL